jgi:hypothetical protein
MLSAGGCHRLQHLSLIVAVVGAVVFRWASRIASRALLLEAPARRIIDIASTGLQPLL